MFIFIVYKHYVTSDHDGWKYWLEKETISYHSTKENAEDKVKSLVEKNNGINTISDPEDEEYDNHLYFVQCVKLEN